MNTGIFFILLKLLKASDILHEGSAKFKENISSDIDAERLTGKKHFNTVENVHFNTVENVHFNTVDNFHFNTFGYGLHVSKKQKLPDSFNVPMSPVDIPEHLYFPSCLRKTTDRLPRPPRSVSFTAEVIEAVTYVTSGIEAENRFFDSLYEINHNRSHVMIQQGLILSNSETVFQAVAFILQNEDNEKLSKINFLSSRCPYVFFQNYPSNLFHGILEINAKSLLSKFPNSLPIQTAILKESLRNPELDLVDEINYSCFDFETLFEFKKLADKANHIKILCKIISKSSIITKEEASILIQAVEDRNLYQINSLITKKHAFYPMIYKFKEGKYKGLNAIDLAIILFDQDLDESYSVFLTLMKSLENIDLITDFNLAKKVIQEFVNNCVEADENESIMVKMTSYINISLIRGIINGCSQNLIYLLEESLDRLKSVNFNKF